MGEVNLFEVEGTPQGGLHGHGVEIHVNGEARDGGVGLAKGECGTLMVRPEFVRFMAPTDTNDFIVRGLLRAEYALGSRIQYEVESSDGSRLTVEKLREDRYTGEIGDEVILGWDVDHTHLIRLA
jgi:spermidine/putrescine transport system ATP-binding protein